LENSLAGPSSGTVILPITDVQCLPSARGQEVAPPPLPREGVNNSIRDEISRDAKHVGETRRCTRRGATRRARRVSSGIVTRRRLTAWNNKFYCYIFFLCIHIKTKWFVRRERGGLSMLIARDFESIILSRRKRERRRNYQTRRYLFSLSTVCPRLLVSRLLWKSLSADILKLHGRFSRGEKSGHRDKERDDFFHHVHESLSEVISASKRRQKKLNDTHALFRAALMTRISFKCGCNCLSLKIVKGAAVPFNNKILFFLMLLPIIKFYSFQCGDSPQYSLCD